jgi:N-acetylmuramoyl-L-alanine amidase
MGAAMSVRMRVRRNARMSARVSARSRAPSTPVLPTRFARLLAAMLLAGIGGCALAPPGPPIDATTHTARGQDSRVLFLVIHFTDETLAESLRILTQQDVSAHYLVTDEPAPRIYRLVDEDRRAWHAGVSSWGGHAMLNASSIGIEIVNPGRVPQPDGSLAFAPYSDAQMDLVLALVKDIVARHRIRPDRVLGHSDIAPQRRVDPGPLFPWHRLAAEGLVAWPDAARVAAALPGYEQQLPDVAWFQKALARHGFAVPDHGRLDDATRRVIAAFQMKYRPARHDGEPDAETAAQLHALGAVR